MNIVKGQECLSYVNKPLCFQKIRTVDAPAGYDVLTISGETNYCLRGSCVPRTILGKWEHNTNARKVGIINKRFDDGGLDVSILGSEFFDYSKVYLHDCQPSVSGLVKYEPADIAPPTIGAKKRADYMMFPMDRVGGLQPGESNASVYLNGEYLGFDEMIDVQASFDKEAQQYSFGDSWTHQTGYLTNDKNNTLRFGLAIDDGSLLINDKLLENPLQLCFGDLYQWAYETNIKIFGVCPPQFEDINDIARYPKTPFDYSLVDDTNSIAIVYNLILTESESYAKAYLTNGTLPPDAILYPLDWDSLPGYEGTDDSQGDDIDDGGGDDPRDRDYDLDDNLPVVPTYTPSSLSNNNYYWLTAPQLYQFISWFWYDVGSISGIEDILQKVQGLYNDLASAIISLRYMPVDSSANMLGGLGEDSNIVVGPIEKQGSVNTLAKKSPPINEIGHIHINKKFNNFLDYAPYTQIAIYLPLHGFLDIDTNMFMGHDLYVKTVCDYISGTMIYYIYLDNKTLVNSIQCKMAVDIPLTLQSKNDRDSAIFSNVSNTISGLIGGAMSVASGNPLGVVYGASAVNNATLSAPLRVMGTQSEQPAFYTPNQCAVIYKRPVSAQPDNYNSRVGYLSNKQKTLSTLSGYTQVYNPRITFKKGKPLSSEIDKIYSLLERGVII